MVRNELKAVMVLNGDTQDDLAAYLHRSPQAICAKIKGAREFTRPEIEKIALRYHLDAGGVIRIFFPQIVAQSATK